MNGEGDCLPPKAASNNPLQTATCELHGILVIEYIRFTVPPSLNDVFVILISPLEILMGKLRQEGKNKVRAQPLGKARIP